MEIFRHIKLFFNQISTKTEQSVARILLKNSMTISVAESCTGGLISSRLTDIAGSSVYIKENYVTYANEAKVKLLGVSEKTLVEHGAVSAECANEMAEGLFERTKCDVALVTTGIAGPAGATEDKSVGLIYIGIKNKYTTKIQKLELNPNYKRKEMKFMFSQKALELLIEFLQETDLQQKSQI